MDIGALRSKLENAYGTIGRQTDDAHLDQDAPADYRIFLGKIGGGTVGQMYFELYDKPLRSKQIYGETAPAHLDDLLFIGDDYNGYCVALDPTKGWAVVEVDKVSRETAVLAKDLFSFLMNDPRLDPSNEQA